MTLSTDRDRVRLMIPLEERFWRKVTRDGEVPSHCPELGQCWRWHGSTNEHGYGQLQAGRRGAGLRKAHRVSWDIHHPDAPVAPEMRVLHRCDNPNCTNPEHLFVGTQGDNMRDAVAKGRWRPTPRFGVDHHASKLTEADVRAIRVEAANGVPQVRLAERFGVTRTTVNDIVKLRSWQHLPEEVAA